MTTKRAIRPQWLIFILLAVGLTAFLMFFSDSGGYTRVDTSAALDLIATDKVDTARVVNNERIELALKDGVTYSDGARSRTRRRSTPSTSTPVVRRSSRHSMTIRRPRASPTRSTPRTGLRRCSAWSCR